MSIARCEKHDEHYDTDYHLECPRCVLEEAGPEGARAIMSLDHQRWGGKSHGGLFGFRGAENAEAE